MSSSNLVRITYIPETTYGVTPATGNFKTARFISEGLSGSPDTVESQQIRVDRMSGGQIVTGLQVGGDLSFELAKEAALDDFMSSAMYSPWNVLAAISNNLTVPASAGVDLTITLLDTLTRSAGSWATDGVLVGDLLTLAGFTSPSNNAQVKVTAVISATVIKIARVDKVPLVNEVATGTTFKRDFILARASGSWITDGIVVGDFATLTGFVATENNTQLMVTQVRSATEIKYSSANSLTPEVGAGTTFARADKLVIGTTKSSFSMEKKFLDLTDKGINYRGMIVSQMSLNVAFGELINGSFSFSGNDYVVANQASELMTNSRTITAPATSGTLNGSIDMPFLASGAIGTFEKSQLGIQSVSFDLNNNLSAQNVIGDIAPIDYSAGTANIPVNLTAYLSDDAWAVMPKKLTQESFQLGFMVKNAGGWYGFYAPAIQVSFDDPASGGQNQDILLEMQGVAKVGDNGESAFTIYRS